MARKKRAEVLKKIVAGEPVKVIRLLDGVMTEPLPPALREAILKAYSLGFDDGVTVTCEQLGKDLRKRIKAL